jgi:uncharacterized protein YoxC
LEHMNAVLNENLNVLVTFSLVFLSVSLLLLTGAAMTLIPQISRTLTAAYHLTETLNRELEPTLREVQKVVISVGELKAIASRGVTIASKGVGDVSAKVEDVTDKVSKVSHQAKKESAAMGAGLMAAFRDYLTGSKSKEHTQD